MSFPRPPEVQDAASSVLAPCLYDPWVASHRGWRPRRRGLSLPLQPGPTIAVSGGRPDRYRPGDKSPEDAEPPGPPLEPPAGRPRGLYHSDLAPDGSIGTA